ncbi:MAG: transporter substrate-binding domain-containing protein [Caldilineaceae bacterium]|nr:transporter substrate-binding domain-containing protein [Caldilineaceae bacterium]MCB0140731.1 transporter substrate-binding domain-containing protein [Caldilineaceae bacterium]
MTPGREAQVDFSQIYYVSEGAVLAAAGSNIGPIGALSDVAAYRVAVQQSSIYADRLQDELVATGLMDAANLFTYDEADHAVRDLKAGRVDLVVLDLLPAEKFASQGGVTLVGQGFSRQRYAVAVPKGATELQTQINLALSKVQNQGAIANLVEEYLALATAEILPMPSPTPLPPASPPAATPTVAPSPTPGCIDSMAFVNDLSYDDYDMTAPPLLEPGQTFRKGWRVLNNGACTWGGAYTLSYAQGNAPWPAMSGQSVTVQSNVAPGATYDFYFDLVAPAAPGTYRVIWQMHNNRGVAFGDRVWVGITVPNPATPPPSSAIQFKLDRPNIRAGDCTTFR